MKKPQVLKTNPERPAHSFRVTLTIEVPRQRIDQVLMAELRKQDENLRELHIRNSLRKEKS